MRRVNEAVRAVVAEAVGELKDPRIGLVTVTGVAVSPRPARGHGLRRGARQREEAAGDARRASTRRTAYLQARLARELRLKRTPHLTFEYDPSVERGVRMTKLIDELAPGGASDDTARDGADDAD